MSVTFTIEVLPESDPSVISFTCTRLLPRLKNSSTPYGLSGVYPNLTKSLFWIGKSVSRYAILEENAPCINGAADAVIYCPVLWLYIPKLLPDGIPYDLSGSNAPLAEEDVVFTA